MASIVKSVLGKSGTSSASVTLPGVTAGNTIVVFMAVGSNSSSATSNVSDNIGNTYTKQREVTNGLNSRISMFSAVASSSGNITITGTYSVSSKNVILTAIELSGTSGFDVSAGDTNITASPNITTTSSSIILASFANNDNFNSHVYTEGTGYTLVAKDVMGTANSIVESKTASPAGTYNASVTMSGDTSFTNAVNIVAAFKDDPAKTGDASLVGYGTLSASGTIINNEKYGDASLTGIGILSSDGQAERTGQASIIGNGVLSTEATAERTGQGALIGSGTLSATAIQIAPVIEPIKASPLYVTDISGNTEALSGYKTLKRLRSVSGEKTLAFLILPTSQNTHSFNMVQEESIAEFKGETYRIKQMNEKSKGPVVFKEVVAIHTFFDLIDEFVYDTYTGSMTFQAALQFVLGPFGYTWDILDTFYAQDFENFGNGNPIKLFNELRKRYGFEYTLNGTHLTFKKKIGNATDFQFRYNYNIKTITRSVNTNNLSTYIRGFGAKNEDGSYAIQSEYTSPNASIFGIKHADPVYDERYTTVEGLDERLREIKDTPDVSVTVDFVDMRRAGYPYDVPNEGDDVFLIFEPMNNLDLETRIIDITEEFAEFIEYPVKTDVTLANYRKNMTDQFVEFSRTQKTVTDIVEGNTKLPYSVLDDAVKRATEALQSAQTELEFSNGIIARDKNDPNKLVLFNSGGMGVSTDNGVTFRTAMTADGIVADLITAGTMLFDRMQGGFLRLGDAYDDGELHVYNANGNIIGRVDTNGAYFPYVKADNIVGNVVNKHMGYSMTYWVDCDNGNDANNGLTSSTPKRNLQALIDSFPKDLNSAQFTIWAKGTYNGTVNVWGFKNGTFVIASWQNTTGLIINGGMDLGHNEARCHFENFTINGISVGGHRMFWAHDCSNIYCYVIKTYGNGDMDSFGFERTRFQLQDCHSYNVSGSGIYAGWGSHGFIWNCKGNSGPTALYVTSGSIVLGTGTRWAGAVQRLDNTIVGKYTDDGNYWQNDAWTIDYGEATPPAPPPPTEQTMNISASTGDNYSTSGYWTNDEVKQGNWGYGDRYGLWYMDLSALKGKNIISATITVNNISAGNSGNKTIFIRTHAYTSRGARPAGTPAMSPEYTAATVANGGAYTIDVTSLVQSKIASGPDLALGIYTTGTANYMKVTNTPSMSIRYS